MEINNVKNRVFEADCFELGKKMPYALNTKDTSIYRVTGFEQLADIVNTGLVKPKDGKIKGGHQNEVFWTIGGNGFFYYDKRPVLEVNKTVLKDGQIGAVSIDDLSSIWIYYEKEKAYINRLEIIREMYAFVKNNNMNLTKERLIELFNKRIPKKDSEEVER